MAEQMREIKFRVYYEAELNGEKIKGIEEPCSWFLLTQTGQIMEYGPLQPPSRPNKGYTKLIPLFFTGLKDKNGVEIYEGDIIDSKLYDGTRKNYVVVFRDGSFMIGLTGLGKWIEDVIVIGNIYQNPELLSEAK